MNTTSNFESRKEERKAQKNVNADLFEISRKYHDAIPVADIADSLKANGFDAEPLDGIYCGREGRLHEQVGPKTWILLTWFRMDHTNRYEINSYVS